MQRHPRACVTPPPPKRDPDDVGTVNQAVLHALLTHNWPELDRLVPRQPVQDPSPEVQDALFHVE